MTPKPLSTPSPRATTTPITDPYASSGRGNRNVPASERVGRGGSLLDSKDPERRQREDPDVALLRSVELRRFGNHEPDAPAVFHAEDRVRDVRPCGYLVSRFSGAIG